MTFPRNILVVLAALLACAFAAGPAQAVTYNVNSTGDQPDASPGDQICNSDTQGCTLRAAVEEAGADDNFVDNTINVPAGTYSVLRPLRPSFTTHIVGAGARGTVIRRDPQAGSVRVFEIDFATVDISGVTIRDGIANINNGFFGGNVRAQNSNVTITSSTITGGNASSGGGLSNVTGTMTVRSSTLTGNTALTGGGDAGAIQNAGNSDIRSDLTVENSTISGNRARLAGAIISGGNILNSVTIRNSTIANNDATSRLDLPNGGGMSILEGSASVNGSIVANNTSVATSTPNCASDPGGPTNPPGVISSGGENIENGTDCGFKAGGDLQVTDPQLGALADNGGPTDTRALPSTSPARDAIASGSEDCPPTDQRGTTRPQGAGCDIGAFELIVAPPSPAPDTTIISAPPAITRDRTPTFTFSSNRTGTTFECSLNSGPFLPCSSPFSLPRLPAGTHTLEVRARDSAGTVDPTPASFTFAIPAQLTDLGAPAIGRSVNAEPVSGSVFVAVPAGASRKGGARAAQKGLRFVPLREAKQIPVGSFFNTRRGSVRLQTATMRRGRRQAGVFSGGLFQTLQSRRRSAKGVFEVRLKGSSFRGCRGRGKRASVSTRGERASAAARRSRRTIRRLRGSARGRFRTRGRYSAATVRGTAWTVTDRCDGTLTRVSSGRVTVRDFRRRKNVTVRRGKSYLARAPG